MNTSFLYHELGLKSLRYLGCEWHKGRSIIKTESKHKMLCCPKCGSKHLIKNGTRTRDFHSVPIGRRPETVRVRLQRYKCRECDFDAQESIPFADGSCSYTHRFASYVLDLLKLATIKDVAALLCVSRDTVKGIHKRYLKRKYAPPKIKSVKRIGIDEFAIRKGHVYMTIVVDLDTGRIIHVGNGKGKDALAPFWKRKTDAEAYFLKEYLKEIWSQPNKEEAEKVLNDWVRIARLSGQKQLIKMAATLLAHRWGILAWYDHHISSGKVEGINNKIKVMKRNAYGFRDNEYFKLRLLGLHECRITRNVG